VLDDVVEELKSWLMGFELLVVVMDLEMMLPVLLSRGGDDISSLDRMLSTDGDFVKTSVFNYFNIFLPD